MTRKTRKPTAPMAMQMNTQAMTTPQQSHPASHHPKELCKQTTLGDQRKMSLQVLHQIRDLSSEFRVHCGHNLGHVLRLQLAHK
jgi:hypothetical protein